MKKYLLQSLLILAISMFAGVLMPNFLKLSKTIELPNSTDFALWTAGTFIFFSVFIFLRKPVDTSGRIPDGYHELYNAENKISKKGMFHSGQQINGTKYVYKKDGSLSHIETYTNGIYTKEDSV